MLSFGGFESSEAHHFEHLDLLVRLALERFRVENDRFGVFAGRRRRRRRLARPNRITAECQTRAVVPLRRRRG